MDYQDFKSFYQSNILLFIILLFVLVYIFMNWNLISNGKYFEGDYIKTILITGIIFLILHMFITWDDNNEQTKLNEDEIIIPKYKFQSGIENNSTKNNLIPINTGFNNNQVIQNPQSNPNQYIPESKPVIPEPKPFVQDTQSLNNKYKVVNKFNPNPIPNQNYNINQNLNHTAKMENFINNYSNGDPKLSNQNIFISHKNSSKYGLKF